LAAFSGCPDRDGDGVADQEDDCPDQAGLPGNNGCPLADADADGIPDEQDDCPGEAGPASLSGCPDRDGDGVADKDDNCPDAAGSIIAGGCPDSDGDGVADPDDRCPNSTGPASNNGCPEISEEDEDVLDFATQAVQFETGSARLRAESREVLDQIVEIMHRYPDYKLRISGHTDSIGSSSTNQKLSQDRAESCYEYLVSKGISPDRMSYAGYGESRPIADNRYKDGREQNRRVEFDLFLNK
jgi:OOP family OmpA-OmpF porin